MEDSLQNKKFLIGTSWKMNKTNEAAAAYIEELAEEIGRLRDFAAVQIFVLPPFTAISDVRRQLKEKNLPVLHGAQNVCWAEEGAYTGEVSASMIKGLDCHFVEVNHQERRKLFNETDQTANWKIKQILKYKMSPIVCLGDEEKTEWAQTEIFLKKQITALLADVAKEDIENVILAYEPLWAIGQTAAAPVSTVAKVHALYRQHLIETYGEKAGMSVRILYGGSVTAENAGALLQVLDVDGLFIGRAALSAKGLIDIACRAF